jgi:hypothetical protein
MLQIKRYIPLEIYKHGFVNQAKKTVQKVRSMKYKITSLELRGGPRAL